MNKKQIIYDAIDIFIWGVLFTCVFISGYLVWCHGWRL